MQQKSLLRFGAQTLWYFIVPAAIAALIVQWLAAAEGPLGEIAVVVRDQRLPSLIVFFTLAEMTLYYFRHALPLGDYLSESHGVPRALLGETDEARQLADEVSRIFERNAPAVDKRIAPVVQEKIRLALGDLRKSLDLRPFEEEPFRKDHHRLAVLADEHLARYRKGELREYFEPIGLAVLVALLLRAVVVEAFKIPSGSMLPTLQIDDHIFVNKFVYGPKLPFTGFRLFPNVPPKRADVMVFEFPDPEPGQEGQDFIKRVIALPGDTLTAEYGHPIINGWRVPSCRVGMYPYREHDGHTSPYGELFVEFLGEGSYLTVYEQGAAPAREGPFHVGPGEVYVMGDNRNNSHDSRRWRGGQGGGVPYANIQGRAMMVWLPFSRFWVSVLGRPTLPKGVPAALEEGVAKCLAERPSETTPPLSEANSAR